MKIVDYKIKLKDLKVTPFQDVKINTIKDVMYFYYTLEIKSDKKKIKFKAYDCPNIQNLGDSFTNLKNSTQETEMNGYTKKEIYLPSLLGLEHNIKISKFTQIETGFEQYTLHIYENFGNNVEICGVTKEEMLELINYVNKKIDKCIKKYNKEVDEI